MTIESKEDKINRMANKMLNLLQSVGGGKQICPVCKIAISGSTNYACSNYKCPYQIKATNAA